MLFQVEIPMKKCISLDVKLFIAMLLQFDDNSLQIAHVPKETCPLTCCLQ